ncbi:MAG: radical SAM protein [Candidatus Thermoplasmatota archaeon]
MKEFYYPGNKFPSVSITGESCALSCPHCEGRFLEGMVEVSDPEGLYEFALDLEESSGTGFLLSGGCNEQGKIPIEEYFGALSKIDETTDLSTNVHTGLPTKEMVEGLVKAEVDSVSYDMIGSKRTIENIYGLDATPEDYKEGYQMLKNAGLKVTPHITVGLNGGELDGEFKAVELLEKPKKIVLNSLIPNDFGKRVSKEDFFSVMEHIDDSTEILLGCMRERGRNNMEIEALKRGAKGIVLPSKKTQKWAEQNFDLEKIEKCCVV